MINSRSALFVVLSLLATGALAQVNALPPTRHVLVYGDAEARAIPDRFKITVQFEAVDADADAARSRVEANMQNVLAKLKKSGVRENEIVATSLQIGSRERFDEKLREPVFLGTEVKRSLTATFPSLTVLQAFLGGLDTSKELKVSSVDTALADEQGLRRALREKSIQASREKAETIARAYGATLGKLYSVSDVAPQFEYGIRAGSWSSGYVWTQQPRAMDVYSLDRVEVTGTRVRSSDIESFQTGFVTFQDKIYAVFLLAD